MNPTSRSPINRILTAIAEKEGEDLAAMNPPLADVIDPDAVERLLTDESTAKTDAVEIRFTYREHSVIARRNGEIEIQ